MSRQKSDEDFWTSFKNEFRLENFSLNFESNSQFLKKEPEVVLAYFHTTIWPCCNKLVYLIYRIAIAIYYTFWLIESIIRNAEFITKDIKIKNNLATFSIHPWPLYMTSWSLTILFAHLWISAFVSLYFYSINEKSCLASVFSQLFGPFSCSLIPPRQKSKQTWFGRNKICSLFIKKQQIPTTNTNNTTSPISNPLSVSNLNHLETREQTSERSTYLSIEQTTKNQLLKNSPPASLTVRIENASLSNNNSDTETNNQIVFLPNDQNHLGETYCDIPVYHLCNIPSSIAVSNAQHWKLWIDTHVPSFILILIKIDWLLFNLVAVSALIVTCMYFTYSYVVKLEAEPSWIHEIGNFHRHGINSVVALVDIIMLGFPIRVYHFVYIIIYGWVYALVTVIYWYQNPDENVIYDAINYKEPLKMIIGYALLTMLVFFYAGCPFFCV
jgi:hypothetical protein